MDDHVHKVSDLTDEQVMNLIKQRKTFILSDVGFDVFPQIIDKLEKMIESEGLRCRTYTKGRTAAIAAELALGGVGLVVGAGILAHNLATLNPDYEIAKNYITGTLTVSYMRKD